MGISIDSPEQNSSMVNKLRLPFPLLSDPDRSRAIEPYGVANDVDPRNLAHPAVIVVDPDGAEVYREVGRDFADRITEHELLDAIGVLNLPSTIQSPIDPGSGEPGPRAMPVHAMIPYFRGARFAAVALGARHASAKEDADRYVAQMDRYMESVKGLRSE